MISGVKGECEQSWLDIRPEVGKLLLRVITFLTPHPHDYLNSGISAVGDT